MPGLWGQGSDCVGQPPNPVQQLLANLRPKACHDSSRKCALREIHSRGLLFGNIFEKYAFIIKIVLPNELQTLSLFYNISEIMEPKKDYLFSPIKGTNAVNFENQVLLPVPPVPPDPLGPLGLPGPPGTHY